MIASAHTDTRIHLWWRDPTYIAPPDPVEPREAWKDYRILSGHLHEVVDLAFSPDSKHLVSAGMHGGMVVHDLDQSVPVVQIAEAHARFCHGVAWDPWNRYVASLGSQPSLQFYTINSKTDTKRLQLVNQRKAQCSLMGEVSSLQMRRASWSPDGSLLAVPYGKSDKHDPLLKNCIYIFLRSQLENPAARLIIKGLSPIRGTLWASCFLEPFQETEASHAAKGSWGPSDYRMVLAAWTEDTVYVYTTDCASRNCDFTDLHMHNICDVAWSHDASFLFTCSLDGYVSIVHFTSQTLGVAHRFPTFSPSAMANAVSSLLRNIRAESEFSEQSKTIPPAAAGQDVVHKARKKKKIEAKASERPLEVEDVNAEELARLLD
jgi:chromatin assembly factor 1 subunit B